MLTPEEANLLLTNLSGRTCDLSYENGCIIISLMPDGGIIKVRPAGDTFSFGQMGIVADYRIGDADRVGCEHPEDDVECIAQLEYPGGSISWCKRCGAWRDDEKCEWNVPEAS